VSKKRASWSWLWPGVLFVGVALLGWLGPIFVLPLFSPDPCVTEIKRQLHDVAGLDFEISETQCDLLAKDAGTSVLVSKTGEYEKTLLFKFGPIDDDLLPEIQVDQRGSTILISISNISFIYSQRDRWRDMAIKYDIGHIDYPSVSKVQDQASPSAK
jgi:hypothetical protein